LLDVKEVERCVGRTVRLIYVDTGGKFTMRRVDLFSVRNGRARVYDSKKRGFRTLAVDRILAIQASAPRKMPERVGLPS